MTVNSWQSTDWMDSVRFVDVQTALRSVMLHRPMSLDMFSSSRSVDYRTMHAMHNSAVSASCCSSAAPVSSSAFSIDCLLTTRQHSNIANHHDNMIRMQRFSGSLDLDGKNTLKTFSCCWSHRQSGFLTLAHFLHDTPLAFNFDFKWKLNPKSLTQLQNPILPGWMGVVNQC